MNIEDQVAVLFARANPVPSLDLLDPIDPVDIDALRDESERSSAMSEVKTIEPRREDSNRRRFATWPRAGRSNGGGRGRRVRPGEPESNPGGQPGRDRDQLPQPATITTPRP